MARIFYKDNIIFDDITVANTFVLRLIGLLRTKCLNENQGLLLEKCRQVHTFGMKFPIDVVFLAEDGQVLHYVEALKPGKISPCIKDTYWILEVQAGTFKTLIDEPHQKLRIN